MKKRWKILICIFIVLTVLGLWVELSVKPKHLTFGVTFSQEFASGLGLDWKQAYLAMLDDLKVKNLRLITYWDIVESKKDEFNFADVDWQISKATKRGANVVLIMGRKTPRWPECHIPAWAGDEKTPSDKLSEALLSYIKTTIEHYKNNPAITAWQIENEPLFPFGTCSPTSLSVLNDEIKLVRSLDSRPIMLTDSGELGFGWPLLSVKADIFGSTLYRYVHNRVLGDIKYSLIPEYYFKIKVWWANIILGKQVVIAELQAEPWSNVQMDPARLKEIVNYASGTGFSKAYLWGAEWWYWMKEKQGKPEMWNTVKDLLNNKQ